MGQDGTNGSPPADTEEKIMWATYRALCDRGYADLTMQAIADEFDKSKGVIHYHYDTKDDLLVAFLEYLLDNFGRTVDAADEIAETADPADRLLELIDILLFGSEKRRQGDTPFDHWDLVVAMLQIRSAAPYTAEFRRQLTTNNTTVAAMLVAIIDAGIERGQFRDVDPEPVAAMIISAIAGARIYQVTLERDDRTELTRTCLEAIVREWLCATDED